MTTGVHPAKWMGVPALSIKAEQTIIAADATYNIGVGAAGVDPTQHNRELDIFWC